MLSKEEEIVLHFVQRNGNIENLEELSMNEINVAVEDLIARDFVKGEKTEQGVYMEKSVMIKNRGKLYLEQLSSK